MSSFFWLRSSSSSALPCANDAVHPVLSGWFYGADTLSFHFRGSAWFSFPSFGLGGARFGL